jgi:hypothetical protein
MSAEIAFNLEQARDFVRANKQNNGLDVELVIDALDSIAKRNEYLKYFYDLFIEIIGENQLVLDRIGKYKDANGRYLRHKYEATAFAFLSNLHELIDSYPFIYLGTYKAKIVNPKYLNWKSLEDSDQTPVLVKVSDLKNSDLYIKLDSINNFKKHRALPKVSNKYTHLEVNIFNNQFENLQSLMIDLHDNLIPKYLEVLNLTFSES